MTWALSASRVATRAVASGIERQTTVPITAPSRYSPFATTVTYSCLTNRPGP